MARMSGQLNTSVMVMDHLGDDASSSSSQKSERLIQRAARSHCTILLTGETGVGKGRLAVHIHDLSPRRDKPFVPINCGSIPEGLIDSQMFGHVKGAFSGAERDHIGFVRAAEGGTLFLDEVGDLPHTAQNRLLRLMQEREIQPVGQASPQLVDVRVIAATNTNLHQAVQEKRFREDLLFRLEVIVVPIEPLRQRRGEIEKLLRVIDEEFSEIYGHPRLKIDTDALLILKQHHWPGNVRQLRTVVERLHVLCPSERITPDILLEIGRLQLDSDSAGRIDVCQHGSEPRVVRSIDQVKLDALQQVLAETGGSVTRAAHFFGVNRSTIYRWLNKA